MKTADQLEPPLRPSERGGWDLELPLESLPRPVDAERMFGRVAPLEIEIGSGTGVFLSAHAVRNPGTDFLAIESARSEVHRAKEKWRRRGLMNVRIVHCDAIYFIEEFLAAESVAGYTILYSDPWPKKRHHKRRLFQPRLLAAVERTLLPGGHVFIKTDVTAYYEVIRDLFAESRLLRLECDTRLDLNPEPDDIVTNFQRKAVEQGHPIHKLQYKKSHLT